MLISIFFLSALLQGGSSAWAVIDPLKNERVLEEFIATSPLVDQIKLYFLTHSPGEFFGNDREVRTAKERLLRMSGLEALNSWSMLFEGKNTRPLTLKNFPEAREAIAYHQRYGPLDLTGVHFVIVDKLILRNSDVPGNYKGGAVASLIMKGHFFAINRQAQFFGHVPPKVTQALLAAAGLPTALLEISRELKEGPREQLTELLGHELRHFRQATSDTFAYMDVDQLDPLPEAKSPILEPIRLELKPGYRRHRWFKNYIDDLRSAYEAQADLHPGLRYDFEGLALGMVRENFPFLREYFLTPEEIEAFADELAIKRLRDPSAFNLWKEIEARLQVQVQVMADPRVSLPMPPFPGLREQLEEILSQSPEALSRRFRRIDCGFAFLPSL